MRRLTRRKHVFAAHGTVVLVFVLEALVGVEDRDRDAHAALTAVSKGLDASDTTESTLDAVKGFLGLSWMIIIHKA